MSFITDGFAKYPIPTPLFTKSSITSVVGTSISGSNFFTLPFKASSNNCLVDVLYGCNNNEYFCKSSILFFFKYANSLYFLFPTKQLSNSIKSVVTTSFL